MLDGVLLGFFYLIISVIQRILIYLLDFSIYIHTVVLSLVEVHTKNLPKLIHFSVYYSDKY